MRLMVKQELDKRLIQEHRERSTTQHTIQAPQAQTTKQRRSVHSLGSKLRSSLKIPKHLLKLGRHKQSQVAVPVHEMNGDAIVLELEGASVVELPGNNENSIRTWQETFAKDIKSDTASSSSEYHSIENSIHNEPEPAEGNSESWYL